MSVRGKGTLRVFKACTGTSVARLTIGTAVAVGRLDMDIVHHHRLIHLGKEIHAPHGERADRLAMIPLGETHKPRLSRASRLLTVLERHLERRLHGGRAVIVEMEFRQTLGHERRQPLRELDRGAMGEIRKDDVLELIQLRRNPRIDLLVRMPEEIRPPRADDIEIALSVHVVEPRPLCVVDHHRRQLLIVLHLRTRMPDMAQVALLNRRHKMSPPTKQGITDTRSDSLTTHYSYSAASASAPIGSSAAPCGTRAKTCAPVISSTIRTLSSCIRPPCQLLKIKPRRGMPRA